MSQSGVPSSRSGAFNTREMSVVETPSSTAKSFNVIRFPIIGTKVNKKGEVQAASE
jgi:hypothetical protein